jgi:uncharacterized lipoprotein YajG
MLRKLAVLPLLFILAACAAPPAPKSFDDHVAAIRTALTLTNDTATVLVNGGHISKEKGRTVLERTVETRKATDVADSFQDLNDVTAILKEVQDDLCRDLPQNQNCALLLSQGAAL